MSTLQLMAVERRLYSDLMRGKTVVVESFTGACPVLTGKLAAMQDWLGERLGREVAGWLAGSASARPTCFGKCGFVDVGFDRSRVAKSGNVW